MVAGVVLGRVWNESEGVRVGMKFWRRGWRKKKAKAPHLVKSSYLRAGSWVDLRMERCCVDSRCGSGR